MKLFEFSNYRDYLKNWLEEQPNSGRGIANKLAKHLRVSPVLISQILNGSRNLQPDYAYGLAQFIGLTQTEIEYFLLLVQIENAATETYKEHLKKQIERLQKQSQIISNRVKKDIQLSEESNAKFYSSWVYSAIRLLSDIPNISSPRLISEALNIELSTVNEVLEFLVENQLCKIVNGQYRMGVSSTHLSSKSPWVYSRQIQWRNKAIQKMENPGSSIFYTCPIVLSKKDITWVREQILQLIKKTTDKARDSESEALMCLNIDWFDLYYPTK